MRGDHRILGEALAHGRATGRPIQGVDAADGVGQLVVGVADETGDAVVDDLRSRTRPPGQHRRPAGEGLDHHQTERLGPADRVEQGPRRAQEGELVVGSDLADVADLVVQQRLDAVVEVLDLLLLAHLGRHDQRQSGLVRDRGGLLGTLLRGEPAQEQQVPALAAADRELLGAQPVMDDRVDRHRGAAGLVVRDRHQGGTVGQPAEDVADLRGERAVVGDDHLAADLVVAEQGPEQRVVVDHVEVGDLLVGVQQVLGLDHGLPEQLGGRALPDPGLGHRARAVARGAQQHLVTELLQSGRQPVDHGLGPAVGDRGHRQPGRRDQRDPQGGHHRSFLLVRQVTTPGPGPRSESDSTEPIALRVPAPGSRMGTW